MLSKTFKCVCGNERFYARETITASVIVDGYGEYVDTPEGGLEENLILSSLPTGPYMCARCQRSYDVLEDTGEKPEIIQTSCLEGHHWEVYPKDRKGFQVSYLMADEQDPDDDRYESAEWARVGFSEGPDDSYVDIFNPAYDPEYYSEDRSVLMRVDCKGRIHNDSYRHFVEAAIKDFVMQGKEIDKHNFKSMLHTADKAFIHDEK